MSTKILDGRYVIGDLIGKGGMGLVYAAQDLRHGARVAIKLTYPNDLSDRLAATYLEREGRIGLAIAHPNVVSVLDAGQSDRGPYVVMEYVTGRPLGIVAAETTLTITQAVTIARRILDGVAAIHRAGFLHGDLKTDNVLIDKVDEPQIVKLIDLGLAVERDHRATEPQLVSGTPDYLAPELVAGGPKTVASDVYAVGAIVYELITGSTPFGGGSAVAIMERQLEDVVIPPSVRCPSLAISLALERVVMRALDKQPEARFSDAVAFADALAVAMRDATGAPILVHEFSARAPTLEWTQPAIPPMPTRLGVGTEPPVNEPDRRIAAALESARALVDVHQLRAATKLLAATLRSIDTATPDGWRLALVLSAIHDGLGARRHALEVARNALERADRASSAAGRQRARALIERLEQHGGPTTAADRRLAAVA